MLSSDASPISGYCPSGVQFGQVGSLLGSPQDLECSFDRASLSKHGLAGGEIQVFLSPELHVVTDPGYRYVAQCADGSDSFSEVVGTLWLRRFDAANQFLEDRCLPMAATDQNELLDMIAREILVWHAEVCGPIRSVDQPLPVS